MQNGSVLSGLNVGNWNRFQNAWRGDAANTQYAPGMPGGYGGGPPVATNNGNLRFLRPIQGTGGPNRGTGLRQQQITMAAITDYLRRTGQLGGVRGIGYSGVDANAPSMGGMPSADINGLGLGFDATGALNGFGVGSTLGGLLGVPGMIGGGLLGGVLGGLFGGGDSQGGLPGGAVPGDASSGPAGLVGAVGAGW